MLEYFLPDTCLTLKGQIHKESKRKLLSFDGYFFKAPFYTCINNFASTKGEIELHCDLAMMKYLNRS